MSSYVTRKSPGNTDWFVRARFGMFIHFGLYAMPARHEYVKRRERIPEEKYRVYFDHFNPDLFDAREWARRAKDTGMKYAVITSKHHEGFCLFDSQYTDYKITNTPFGRDLIAEFVEAFRAEGLKVGFYYSLIDWHHQQYPIDCLHPLRDDPAAEALDRGRDMNKYNEYVRDQVRELLTRYGKIDIMWFDYSFPPMDPKPWMQFGGGKGAKEWDAERLIAQTRQLQPGIIINNRSGICQDFWTPEQYQPDEWLRHPETGELVTWETCQTFSGSWGYYRDEFSWKSPQVLINMLVNTVSCGGNLLMNVGPTGRGSFDERAVESLKAFEKWMKYNSRSIYGCTMAEPEFTAPAGTKLTQSEDGKRLYIHLQTYPFQSLTFYGLPASRIEYAQLLHDGSEVPFVSLADCTRNYDAAFIPASGSGVEFSLPVVPPAEISPVIEVFLK